MLLIGVVLRAEIPGEMPTVIGLNKSLQCCGPISFDWLAWNKTVTVPSALTLLTCADVQVPPLVLNTSTAWPTWYIGPVVRDCVLTAAGLKYSL